MNYLSHYYFDLKDDRPDFVLGIALPDLMGSFNRRYKCHEIQDFQSSVPKDLWVLQEGINKHHRLDALFHNGSFFDKQTEWLTEELKSLGLDSIQKYFFFYAHVLLEILLDRILLVEEENIAVNFYQKLDEVKMEIVSDYFAFNKGILRPDDFVDHFDEFMQHRYLFMYAKKESVARALGRIHFRLRGTTLSEGDLEKIAARVDDYTQRIRESYTDFKEVLS